MNANMGTGWTDEHQASEEGYAAYCNDTFLYSDNPYKDVERLASCWSAGYMSAARDNS